MSVVTIDSEDAAWATLRAILDRELDTKELKLDFSKADWAKFSLYYKGEFFHQTLTTSAMKGLVEYQYCLYRSIALLLKNNPTTNSLTDEEKEKFELAFKVEGGSTETSTEGKGVLENLGKDLISKMTGRQVFICVLLIAVLWYSDGMYAKHLSSATEAQRTEAQSKKDSQLVDVMNNIIKSDADKRRILEKAVKQSDNAKIIENESSKALEVIMKNTSGAEYLSLQGRDIARAQIEKFNRRTRRKSDLIQLNKFFVISGIDAYEDKTFVLKVRDLDTDQEFSVSLEDPIVISKYERYVQKALFSGWPVKLIIDAKRRGDEFFEANLVRAYAPKRTSP